jgi:ubiquitin-like 1-activating enzyme E1 B
LAQEAQALKAILASADEEGFARRVFDKVFCADILRLRSMEDMWKSRKPPTPLKYDDIMNTPDDPQNAMDATTPESGTLKDQRVWTLRETVEMFSDRYV